MSSRTGTLRFEKSSPSASLSSLTKICESTVQVRLRLRSITNSRRNRDWSRRGRNRHMRGEEFKSYDEDHWHTVGLTRISEGRDARVPASRRGTWRVSYSVPEYMSERVLISIISREQNKTCVISILWALGNLFWIQRLDVPFFSVLVRSSRRSSRNRKEWTNHATLKLLS